MNIKYVNRTKSSIRREKAIRSPRNSPYSWDPTTELYPQTIRSTQVHLHIEVLKMHHSYIFQSTTMAFLSEFPDYSFVYTTYRLHACYIPRVTHIRCSELSNNIDNYTTRAAEMSLLI
jgi:hypothetical protein